MLAKHPQSQEGDFYGYDLEDRGWKKHKYL